MHKFHIHLVSDATGTTLQGVARACLAQFDAIEPVEKLWPMVRSGAQMERIVEAIHRHPGPVFYTLVDKELRKVLQNCCHELDLPCMAVLDPIIKGLSSYLGLPSKGVPGLQHALTDEYFRRIEAVDFAMFYDDGQNLEGLEEADVILVGVSRTGKTPTCIFLARRGVRAANIPLAMEVPVPEELLALKGPLFVGLTEDPDRLVQLRRNRLKADANDPHYADNRYLDLDSVIKEIRMARRLFARHGWPVIDVTKRSVEETAAEIISLLQHHKEKLAQS